jgi:hypothetical protein
MLQPLTAATAKFVIIVPAMELPAVLANKILTRLSPTFFAV